MTQNYLCDTTILIDFFFGSNLKISNIEDKTKNSIKHITYLIFGEFIRTIYKTIQKLLNKFLENEDILNNYPDINDFVQDVSKDIYLFSGQEGNQIIKLMPFLIKSIKSKILGYKSLNLPLKLPIINIINDLNSYKNTVLKNFFLLKTSYRCLDFQRRLHFHSTGNRVNFDSPFCPKCKKEVHNFFQNHFLSVLTKFFNDYDKLTSNFSSNEKPKLKESLQFIIKYKYDDIIDGIKHYCWRLSDIYIVLELPFDFILLTTNDRHQKPFADYINKICESI